MRRLLTFPCAGDTLVGTLDEAAGTTALLIVSGGNEVRAGAHRGMALLAGRLAAAGVPVLRFDRRGVGDSGGTNGGYATSGPDIAAAAATIRHEQPQVERIVGFGNCDAASALALFGHAAELDAVVLANPWVVEVGALPPAAAIRRHYRQRLTDPAAWRLLLTCRVDLPSLLKGLVRIVAREPQDLADRVICAVRRWGDDAYIVLASGDATAIAFADTARRRGLKTAVTTIDSPSHSFADGDAAAALETAIGRTLSKGGGAAPIAG